MKSNSFILILLLIPVFFSCRDEIETVCFFDMETEFKDPSAADRPVAFWLWNDGISHSEIDRKFRKFKDAGFGGVFIYQCNGMTDDHFLPELYCYTVDAGKKEGFDVRIYDNNFYPDGFTVDHVSPGASELSGKKQGLLQIYKEFLFEDPDRLNCYHQEVDILAVKKARSIANQSGYRQVSDTKYRVIGEDATFKDIKRFGDMEYVFGINSPDASISFVAHMEMCADDGLPVYKPHLPWWPYSKELNDYFARLSLLLGKGEQLNEILVMEPACIAGSCYPHTDGTKEMMKAWTDMEAFLLQLEGAQVEYDLGSDQLIKNQGRVDNGCFIVGRRAYKTVVVPPVTPSLNKETFELICKFMEEGGELILFSEPTFTEGNDDTGLSLFLSRYASQIKRYDSFNENLISALFDNDRIVISLTKGQGLYHQRRSYQDGELVFLVNSSSEESVSGTISLPGKSLLEADATNGIFYEYPYNVVNDRVHASFNLPPAGSLFLFGSLRKIENYPIKDFFVVWEFMPAQTGPEIQRVRDNVLVVDFCDLIIDGKEMKQFHSVNARKYLCEYFDLWSQSVSCGKSISEWDTFKTCPIKVKYYFTVGDNTEIIRFRMAAERSDVWAVTVNDKPVTVDEGDFWLDPRLGVYPIGSAVEPGRNTIEMTMNASDVFTDIEPVYILGDFTIDAVSAGWEIRSSVPEFGLGSWKEQGLPFYPWEMSYSKDYLIDDTTSSYSVRLDRWEGAVVNVLVNDEKAGIIGDQPYQLDISSFLHSGVNRIEIVVMGKFKNLLGPHHTGSESGLTYQRFRKNGKGPVAGYAYQLSDYGLTDDFTLWKTY